MKDISGMFLFVIAIPILVVLLIVWQVKAVWSAINGK